MAALGSVTRFVVASLCVALATLSASRADDVAPNAHLAVTGMPPVPAELVRALAPYTEFRPRAVASWHPVRRELVVATRARNTTQLHRVRAPGADLVQLTDYAEPVRRGVFLPQRPDTLVFMRDTGGNEQTRLFRLDPGAPEPVALTDPERRSSLAGMDHARRHVLVASVPLDKTGRQEAPSEDVALMDPLQPGKARAVATLPGTGWGGFSFSFDDKRLAMIEYKSVEDTRVHVMNLSTGQRTQVLPRPGDTTVMTTGDVAFARDGAHLFVATDAGGEFRRAALLSLRTGQLRYFGPADADVEQLELSPDGRVVALIVNRAGRGVLELYGADTLHPRQTPRCRADGLGGGVARELARARVQPQFRAKPATCGRSISPPGVWSAWTEAKVEGLDARTFAASEEISWQASTDALSTASSPTARALHGRRPVLIDIHGGPEGQARRVPRPSQLPRERAGYRDHRAQRARLDGYGKHVRVARQWREARGLRCATSARCSTGSAASGLDAARVAVAGGSYGGYMSLAVATHYADRIAGTWTSWASRTSCRSSSTRRATGATCARRVRRRARSGDARDAHAHLAGHQRGRIAKPLLVVHGRNDPRVPYTEAEQIVETVRRNGVPVWYMLADNEGHGFARKDNADFLFAAYTLFLKAVLAL
jgi:dipeptidyl aminopeptidase/acylaminoacyl peptidase